MQKKASLHKTFFSLWRGSVSCMLFIYFVYLVSADPDIGDIDGK